eukprot:TRINITY_DN16888_c0_g1_i2.p1 TRINITY_DN16888_c0_g1~~TRINITY_DN16888_c0_g1_i2.p1  ORF type:complete len:380 (+),score=93.59 TRINITY_DN16888_c0_g1_i2:71-1141(+)
MEGNSAKWLEGAPLSEPGSPPRIAKEGERESDATANAVSQLQEYIQGCSPFSPHRKILTWTFDQQLEKDNVLQFRATVLFFFSDVPHRFSGGWQSSKKKAQRDAAERVQHYLARRFDRASIAAESSQQDMWDNYGMSPEQDRAPHSAIAVDNMPSGFVDSLAAIASGRSDGSNIDDIDWATDVDDQQLVRATLTTYLRGIPHRFCGGRCPTELEARRDCADRILWYFGRGATGAYAVPPGGMHSAAPSQPVPPLDGSSSAPSAASPAEEPSVDDKTILMQVQNTLQKAFAKDTPPGQRVWIWDYESIADTQLFRASVQVPAWGRNFVGDWCKGKKLAQRSCCIAVQAALPELLDQK